LESPAGSRNGRAFLIVGLVLAMAMLLLNPARFKEIDEYNLFWLTDSLAAGKGFTIHQGLLIGSRTGRGNQFFYGKQGAQGFYSPYGPLLSIAYLPYHGLGRLLGCVLALTPVQQELLLWLLAIAFNSMLFLCLYCVLWRMAAPGFSPVCIALLLLSSPLVYYAQSFYAEILLCLLLVLAYLAMEHGKACLAGCLVGLALLTKISAIIFLPLFCLYLFYHHRESIRRLLRAGGAFVGPVAAGLLAYAWYNLYRFGSIFTFGYPQTDEFGQQMNVLVANPWPGLQTLLFSPGKGVFVYFPVGLFFLLTLLRKNERTPAALFILGCLVVPIVFFSFWLHYEGGTCFGPRFLLVSMAFVLLFLVNRLPRAGKRVRVAICLLAAAGMAVNLPACLVHFSRVALFDGLDYYVSREGAYNRAFSPFTGIFRRLARDLDHLQTGPCAMTYDVPMAYVSTFELFCLGEGLDLAPLPLLKSGIKWRLAPILFAAFLLILWPVFWVYLKQRPG